MFKSCESDKRATPTQTSPRCNLSSVEDVGDSSPDESRWPLAWTPSKEDVQEIRQHNEYVMKQNAKFQMFFSNKPTHHSRAKELTAVPSSASSLVDFKGDKIN